jgi:hypothetical protein
MSVNWSESVMSLNKRDRLPTVQEYGLLHDRQKAAINHTHSNAKLYTVIIRGRSCGVAPWSIINVKCVNVSERRIPDAMEYLRKEYRAMGGRRFGSSFRVVEQHVDCVPVRIVRQRDLKAAFRGIYHGV